MNAGKRQMAVLYEFLINNEYLNYKYLCRYFNVSEKTIKEDIRVINDNFSNEKLQIILKKNHGFFLSCDNQALIKSLLQQFDYRFTDAHDIQTMLSDRITIVLAFLLTKNNFVKLDEISLLLNLNIRSVSAILKEVRYVIESYSLKLMMKPHHGIKICGEERRIRYCLIDMVCFYKFDSSNLDFFDDLYRFKLIEKEKQEITEICVQYFKEQELRINQIELRKFIVLILVMNQRNQIGARLKFSEDEIKFINTYKYDFELDKLLKHLEIQFQWEFHSEDFYLLKTFIMGNIDYKFKGYAKFLTPYILNKSEDAYEQVLKCMINLSICSVQNSALLKDAIFIIIIQSTIRSKLKIIEHNPTSQIKKLITNTPLSSSIGIICHKVLEAYYGCKLGENIEINLCLAIYSMIRKTKNVKKMNSIAIFTPADKDSGESLKRRILDRFSNIIKNIDVLTTYDLLSVDLCEYNYLLRFERAKPIGCSIKIPQLEVDYFFTESDVRNFYEYIAIPSRIYRSPFGEIKKEDYILSYEFETLQKLKDKLIEGIKDENIREQIRKFEIKGKFIFNKTLNMIFFATNKNFLVTKLILLKHYFLYRETPIHRIFIYIIFLEGDMIKMKTGEKVIRNLVSIEGTDEIILTDPVINFYDYYINNKDIVLE